MNRQPSRPSTSADARAAAIAAGGKPFSFSSSVIISSQALVESRTFSENFVVTSAKAHVDFLEPGFARRIQLRAMPLERVDGLGEKPPHRARKRTSLIGGGVALDRLPQTFIQRKTGIKRAGFGLNGVIARRAAAGVVATLSRCRTTLIA